MNDTSAQREVEVVWRIESARIVGALARFTQDFSLAEDVAQEALAEALQKWPREGVPPNPAGWLFTVGRRRAVDAFRRRSALDERYTALAHEQPQEHHDQQWDPDAIDDDVLALLFMACHPVLSAEARVGLTLRVVGGLTSEEIARAFLVPVPTIQARITRAKKTLAAARVPFELPSAELRRERLGGVGNVLYLIFSEGANATAGEDLLRVDLADEARRLARVLSRLVPDDPEVHGLLALMELTAARFPARVGPDGAPILLEEQNRRRWDRAAIVRGQAALAQATSKGRGLGAFGLQAAIASCHAAAPSVAETDWGTIVLLYEALGRLAPSPIVDLNRAVAVSRAYGPHEALTIVDQLEGLAGSHLLPSVRGELLAQLGRTHEARQELERAAELCRNERERELLRGKVNRLK
nr:DUF6596 domain-containing protein [Kineosporia babensis]